MKLKKIWIPLLVLVVVFGAVMTAGAASGTPGSEADPVVTKSYVDSAVEKAINTKLSAAVEELKSTMAALSKESDAGSSAQPSLGTAPVDLSFKVLNLAAGTSLYGKSGTEIIVRTGAADAIDNGANGLSDITAGKDISGGTRIETNHLLLCPRDDGRGLRAASDLWIMVRGEYTLQ